MLRRAFLALVATALAAPALASVVVAYDLDELTDRSEAVVAGTVTASQGRYQGRQIVTDVLVRVEEVGKGRVRRGEIVAFVTPGGSVGDVTMRVEGAVRPRAGERALFFLERRRDELLPVGLAQGVMPLFERDGRTHVRSSVPGLELVERGPDGRYVPADPAVADERSLDEVLEHVRARSGGPR